MKQIEIKIYGGHSSEIIKLPIPEAKEYIIQQSQSGNKWIMINGKHYDSLDITEAVIEDAQNITLTNILIGA